MNSKNTLNVCLGHIEFPSAAVRNIDLMIAPKLIKGPKHLAVVDDKLFGENGSSLSEYVQLIWLLDQLDNVLGNCSYIRIFHYRRFVVKNKPEIGIKSTNQPWSTVISESECIFFDSDFDRFSSCEIFNTPVKFEGGVLTQYSTTHVLNDMLKFVSFLIEEEIFSHIEAVEFLREDTLIPASNIGTFKIATFREIFTTLKKASYFLYSDKFTVRQGYQRRSMGFLLERLNSYLILKMMRQGLISQNFGHNIVISDDALVSSSP